MYRAREPQSRHRVLPELSSSTPTNRGSPPYPGTTDSSAFVGGHPSHFPASHLHGAAVSGSTTPVPTYEGVNNQYTSHPTTRLGPSQHHMGSGGMSYPEAVARSSHLMSYPQGDARPYSDEAYLSGHPTYPPASSPTAAATTTPTHTTTVPSNTHPYHGRNPSAYPRDLPPQLPTYPISYYPSSVQPSHPFYSTNPLSYSTNSPYYPSPMAHPHSVHPLHDTHPNPPTQSATSLPPHPQIPTASTSSFHTPSYHVTPNTPHPHPNANPNPNPHPLPPQPTAHSNRGFPAPFPASSNLGPSHSTLASTTPHPYSQQHSHHLTPQYPHPHSTISGQGYEVQVYATKNKGGDDDKANSYHQRSGSGTNINEQTYRPSSGNGNSENDRYGNNGRTDTRDYDDNAHGGRRYNTKDEADDDVRYEHGKREKRRDGSIPRPRRRSSSRDSYSHSDSEVETERERRVTRDSRGAPERRRAMASGGSDVNDPSTRRVKGNERNSQASDDYDDDYHSGQGEARAKSSQRRRHRDNADGNVGDGVVYTSRNDKVNDHRPPLPRVSNTNNYNNHNYNNYNNHNNNNYNNLINNIDRQKNMDQRSSSHVERRGEEGRDDNIAHTTATQGRRKSIIDGYGMGGIRYTPKGTIQGKGDDASYDDDRREDEGEGDRRDYNDDSNNNKGQRGMAEGRYDNNEGTDANNNYNNNNNSPPLSQSTPASSLTNQGGRSHDPPQGNREKRESREPQPEEGSGKEGERSIESIGAWGMTSPIKPVSSRSRMRPSKVTIQHVEVDTSVPPKAGPQTEPASSSTKGYEGRHVNVGRGVQSINPNTIQEYNTNDASATSSSTATHPQVTTSTTGHTTSAPSTSTNDVGGKSRVLVEAAERVRQNMLRVSSAQELAVLVMVKHKAKRLGYERAFMTSTLYQALQNVNSCPSSSTTTTTTRALPAHSSSSLHARWVVYADTHNIDHDAPMPRLPSATVSPSSLASSLSAAISPGASSSSSSFFSGSLTTPTPRSGLVSWWKDPLPPSLVADSYDSPPSRHAACAMLLRWYVRTFRPKVHRHLSPPGNRTTSGYVDSLSMSSSSSLLPTTSVMKGAPQTTTLSVSQHDRDRAMVEVIGEREDRSSLPSHSTLPLSLPHSPDESVSEMEDHLANIFMRGLARLEKEAVSVGWDMYSFIPLPSATTTTTSLSHPTSNQSSDIKARPLTSTYRVLERKHLAKALRLVALRCRPTVYGATLTDTVASSIKRAMRCISTDTILTSIYRMTYTSSGGSDDKHDSVPPNASHPLTKPGWLKYMESELSQLEQSLDARQVKSAIGGSSDATTARMARRGIDASLDTTYQSNNNNNNNNNTTSQNKQNNNGSTEGTTSNHADVSIDQLADELQIAERRVAEAHVWMRTYYSHPEEHKSATTGNADDMKSSTNSSSSSGGNISQSKQEEIPFVFTDESVSYSAFSFICARILLPALGPLQFYLEDDIDGFPIAPINTLAPSTLSSSTPLQPTMSSSALSSSSSSTTTKTMTPLPLPTTPLRSSTDTRALVPASPAGSGQHPSRYALLPVTPHQPPVLPLTAPLSATTSSRFTYGLRTPGMDIGSLPITAPTRTKPSIGVTATLDSGTTATDTNAITNITASAVAIPTTLPSNALTNNPPARSTNLELSLPPQSTIVKATPPKNPTHMITSNEQAKPLPSPRYDTTLPSTSRDQVRTTSPEPLASPDSMLYRPGSEYGHEQTRHTPSPPTMSSGHLGTDDRHGDHTQDTDDHHSMNNYESGQSMKYPGYSPRFNANIDSAPSHRGHPPTFSTPTSATIKGKGKGRSVNKFSDDSEMRETNRPDMRNEGTQKSVPEVDFEKEELARKAFEEAMDAAAWTRSVIQEVAGAVADANKVTKDAAVLLEATGSMKSGVYHNDGSAGDGHTLADNALGEKEKEMKTDSVDDKLAISLTSGATLYRGPSEPHGVYVNSVLAASAAMKFDAALASSGITLPLNDGGADEGDHERDDERDGGSSSSSSRSGRPSNRPSRSNHDIDGQHSLKSSKSSRQRHVVDVATGAQPSSSAETPNKRLPRNPLSLSSKGHSSDHTPSGRKEKGDRKKERTPPSSHRIPGSRLVSRQDNRDLSIYDLNDEDSVEREPRGQPGRSRGQAKANKKSTPLKDSYDDDAGDVYEDTQDDSLYDALLASEGLMMGGQNARDDWKTVEYARPSPTASTSDQRVIKGVDGDHDHMSPRRQELSERRRREGQHIETESLYVNDEDNNESAQAGNRVEMWNGGRVGKMANRLPSQR